MHPNRPIRLRAPPLLALSAFSSLLFSGYLDGRKIRACGWGTGVPRVIHALNLDANSQKNEIDQDLNLRIAAVFGLSSPLGVLAAGSLGREGPTCEYLQHRIGLRETSRIVLYCSGIQSLSTGQ